VYKTTGVRDIPTGTQFIWRGMKIATKRSAQVKVRMCPPKGHNSCHHAILKMKTKL